MERTETLCIPMSHPCLPGHFPGQPVVPGVVMLDQVAACLERAAAGTLRRMAAVKFLAPLLPGEHAQVQIVVDDKRVRFRVLRGDTVLVSGDGELA